MFAMFNQFLSIILTILMYKTLIKKFNNLGYLIGSYLLLICYYVCVTGTPALTGTTTVKITVVNSNDKIPFFSPPTQRAEVRLLVNCLHFVL